MGLRVHDRYGDYADLDDEQVAAVLRSAGKRSLGSLAARHSLSVDDFRSITARWGGSKNVPGRPLDSFTRQMLGWYRLGLTPEEASEWRRHGYLLNELRPVYLLAAERDARLDRLRWLPELQYPADLLATLMCTDDLRDWGAAVWTAAGFESNDQAGIWQGEWARRDKMDLRRDRATGWIRGWLPVTWVTVRSAYAWHHAGFSPAQALPWVEHEIRGARGIPWALAGYQPSDVHRLIYRLTLVSRNMWATGGFSFNRYLTDWASTRLPPHLIAAAATIGLTPRQARRRSQADWVSIQALAALTTAPDPYFPS